MDDVEISQEESLKIIKGMILLAKNKFNSSGFHFILWGVLVILASLSQYILNYVRESNTYYWIWGLVPLIGLPIAFLYEKQRSRKDKTVSKLDKLYGNLWLGFGITLVAIVFVSISNGANPLAFILALVGLAVFVSGKLIEFQPLKLGAIIFWAASIYCSFLDQNSQLLLNAVVILAGYVIPGIILWRKKRVSV